MQSILKCLNTPNPVDIPLKIGGFGVSCEKVWVQINVKNASEAQQAKAKENQGT